MSESVLFWLDNKNCAGTKAAVIGDQTLVFYRDRYYVVTGGAAQIEGGKPLRFSTSSLPSVWKRALKGDLTLTVTSPSEKDSVPTTHPPKRERKKAEKKAMLELQQEKTPEKSEKIPILLTKAPRKTEAKPAIQLPIVTNCPYCNARHEIPVERGKNGKPFFMACSRCKNEFALRFVQVTVYQAQVAGFQ